MDGPLFVEHRRFELLTPTLPVLCATNCANAPNSGYLIITVLLCKDFFSAPPRAPDEKIMETIIVYVTVL